MSDAQYINTYLDFAVGAAHDYLNIVIQLKTQLKIANDILLVKDQTITELTEQKETLLKDQLDKEHLQNLESEIIGLRNKASSFDGIVCQINDMKQIVRDRDQSISGLSNNISDLINEKSVLQIEVASLKKGPPAVYKKKKNVIRSDDDF